MQPQRNVAQLMAIAQALHLQQLTPSVRRARRRENVVQPMAEHFLDDLFAAQPAHGVFADAPPVAQHRQPIANVAQFVDAVRNEHDADAFGLQAAHHVEQALALGAIERRGRFIEHQKTAAVRQRARQQHLLFFRQRAVRQASARVERQRPLLQQLRGAAVQLRPVQPVARLVQPVQHDVLRHRQRGDQRDVDLLLYHVDAVAARLQRGMNFHCPAVDQDLAAVVIVGAGEDRHQRRLARAVGADQRMD